MEQVEQRMALAVDRLPAITDHLMAWVEVVNPTRAAQFLRRNSHDQRSLSTTWVKRLAHLMRSPEWVFNGDPIRFDEKKQLIDGQHRLMALILAEVVLKMVIITGLPEDARLTIDQGRKRTVSQILAGEGVKYASQIAAGARLMHIYETKGWLSSTTGKPFTIYDARAVISEWPTLEWAAYWGVRLSKELGTSALWTFLVALLMKGNDRGVVEKFLNQIEKGEGLYRGDPAFVLRQRVLKMRIAAKTLSVSTYNQEVATVALRAWAAFLEGRKVRTLPVLEADRTRLIAVRQTKEAK